MPNIAKWLLLSYLDGVTIGVFDNSDDPPDELCGFNKSIDSMMANAKYYGEEEELKLGLAKLVNDSAVDLEEYSGGRYPFSHQEMQELIYYIGKRVWDGFPAEVDVVITEPPFHEWLKQRKQDKRDIM